MNVPVNSRSIDIPTEFQSCFDKQRAAYLAAPEPSSRVLLALGISILLVGRRLRRLLIPG